MQRYPSDLVVTVQDFADCGWKDVIVKAADVGYEPLWIAFSDAALHAMEAKSAKQGKALWLLADACAMSLHSSPDRWQAPFASAITHLGWRTAGPDDFTQADLDFFAQVIDATNNPWLKARLADLLWVRKYSTGISMALTCLDSYRQIPVSTEMLQNDWQVCWERAITLTLRLGNAAAENREGIEQSLLCALNAVTKSNGWLAWRLADLLKMGGLAKVHAATIANKLASLAGEYDADTDQVLITTAGALFRRSATWFKLAHDKREATMTAKVAECYVREGQSRIQTHHPSHGAAASFYENAIQIYKTIPRAQRPGIGVDERITELLLQMERSGAQALGEIAEISYPKMDFREQMEWASQAVQSKTLAEALQAFSCIAHPPFRYQDLRLKVLELIRQRSFMRIFPVTVFDGKDGRVVAQVPSLDTNADAADEANRARVFWDEVGMYRTWLNFYVNAFIWPALGSLLLEHRLRETDLIELASRSSIVPPRRERLFGKALFAGFNHDFAIALHLLTPQVEHVVRYHLKEAGADTTYLDKHGVQTENGLSSLCDMPELGKVFGEDLAFEIKALFCSANGPNLRNQLAHGLLDDNDCHSVEVIYAWWLGFRLVYHAFWNSARSR